MVVHKDIRRFQGGIAAEMNDTLFAVIMIMSCIP